MDAGGRATHGAVAGRDLFIAAFLSAAPTLIDIPAIIRVIRSSVERKVRVLYPMLDDETHYKILKLLQEDLHISQRALVEVLGVSLGKTNYCLKALIGRGLVKARNFRNSNNKAAYAYFLTPGGIEEKARIPLRFLQRKMTEYEALEHEIVAWRRELAAQEEREPFCADRYV